MKVTPRTKWVFLYRRFVKAAKADGFERIQGPWDMDRGGRWRETIEQVRFLPGTNEVWIKSDGGKFYDKRQAEDKAYFDGLNK